MDFLIKVFFFHDCFNGHETHWTDHFSEWCPAFVRKTYKMSVLCHCPLPLNWRSIFGMQTRELICVLLGLLTKGTPVHAKLDGGFNKTDPGIHPPFQLLMSPFLKT